MELACEQISQVDVLILDELGEAMRRGFVTREDVEALIAIKPATTELVPPAGACCPSRTSPTLSPKCAPSNTTSTKDS